MAFLNFLLLIFFQDLILKPHPQGETLEKNARWYFPPLLPSPPSKLTGQGEHHLSAQNDLRSSLCPLTLSTLTFHRCHASHLSTLGYEDLCLCLVGFEAGSQVVPAGTPDLLPPSLRSLDHNHTAPPGLAAPRDFARGVSFVSRL